jgi:hypothetical protein
MTAEAVRFLNYASRGDAPGLKYPGDVYSLLGALYTGTRRLPQLCKQLCAFLAGQLDTGRIRDSSGRDPAVMTGSAALALGLASSVADELTYALNSAQQALAGLYVAEAADGQPGGA